MSGKRHGILVVDDETASAFTLARIPKNRGCKMAVANSGEEAVEVACSFCRDFIVSDLTMGTMNGIETILEVLAVLPTKANGVRTPGPGFNL